MNVRLRVSNESIKNVPDPGSVEDPQGNFPARGRNEINAARVILIQD